MATVTGDAMLAIGLLLDASLSKAQEIKKQ